MGSSTRGSGRAGSPMGRCRRGSRLWEVVEWRRGMRSGHGATCGPTPRRAIAPEHLDQILEAARRTPRPATSRPGTSWSTPTAEQLAELARVWRSAGHVARSAATIRIIAPVPGDARSRDPDQYDLGQATMSIMVAAADLGIGSAHSAVADQDLARRLLGFPEGPVLRLADLARSSRRPPAHADPAAQPAPVHRRRAPRPGGNHQTTA